MKKMSILLMLTALAGVASAQWPTTVAENLAVSVDPDTHAIECSAIPYPDGATLVVFRKQWYGNQYQIIDKYGQLKYPTPQYLTPANPSYDEHKAQVVTDECGGVYVVWHRWGCVLAQRLDSLGNIMWGDSGIVASPYNETMFDISDDGEGGLFLAISPDEPDWTDLYVQRIDSEGNLLWGPQGVLVSGIPDSDADYPQITHGLQGEAYVTWHGSYQMWGAIYLQRLSSSGIRLWNEDLFVCGSTVWSRVIPDGEGGVIIQSNPGNADYNTHWRIGPNRNIIWTRDHLSWYHWGALVEGESGYFYLGFNYLWGRYGQKVRISDGQNLWPTWGSGQAGAEMVFITGLTQFNNSDLDLAYIYKNPYFYGALDYEVDNGYPKLIYGQALDSLGQKVMGDNGVLLSRTNEHFFSYICAVPSGEGLVAVYENYDGFDIWAKRANFDGTLGGPTPGGVEHFPVQNYELTINNYPNPFNQRITVEFELPEAGEIELKVFDISGREITTLDTGHLTLGKHSVVWDADGCASGVYFVRLETADDVQTRKIVLLK